MSGRPQEITDQRRVSAQKLEEIRQAVISLFSSQAFREVGMRDICRSAKITPNTIYKYFGNKDALIIRAISPDLDILSESLESIADTDAPLQDRLYSVTQTYFEFYLSHLPIARIVFLYIPSAYFTSEPEFIQTRMLSVFQRLVREGQQLGQIRSDFSPEELVDAVAAVAMRRMFHLVSNPDLKARPLREAERLQGLLAPMLGLSI